MSALDPVIKQLTNTRVNSNTSKREISNILGIHHNNILWWERGKYIPRVHHLEAWAKTLGYKVVITLEEDDD